MISWLVTLLYFYVLYIWSNFNFTQIVKCGKSACCSAMRSDLALVLPDGFFPPPWCIKQDDSTGLLVAGSHSDGGDAKFLPLFQRLSLKVADSNCIPYDFNCPTVQQDINDRICAKCKLYFASKKMLRCHMKSLNHSAPRSQRKLKPECIVTQREGEFLCVIRDEATGANDSEWIPKKYVDTENICFKTSNADQEERAIPLIKNMKNWLTNPWIEDDIINKDTI